MLLAASVFAPPEGLKAMLVGGLVSLASSAWAGYQLWLHPRNRVASGASVAAIRAEVGRVVIVLVSLWLMLKHWPEYRQMTQAGLMLAGLFLVQLAGWVWLARNSDDGDHSPD